MYSDASLNKLSLVFFDVETTGLHPYKGDTICELGAVKFTAQGQQETYSQLLNPKQPIPEFVSNIHNIFDQDVKDAPFFEEAADKFLEFISNSIVCGYNVEFDLGFLNTELDKIHYPVLRLPSLDVLRMARKTYPDLPRYNLGEVARTLEFKTDVLHRAYEDALLTSKIFFHAADVLKQRGISKRSHLLTLYGVQNEFFEKLQEPKEALIRESIEAEVDLRLTCLAKDKLRSFVVKPRELVKQKQPYLLAVDIKSKQEISLPLHWLLNIEIF